MEMTKSGFSFNDENVRNCVISDLDNLKNKQYIFELEELKYFHLKEILFCFSNVVKQDGKACKITHDAAEASNLDVDIEYLLEYDSLYRRISGHKKAIKSLELLPRRSKKELIFFLIGALASGYNMLIRMVNELNENVRITLSGLEDPPKHVETQNAKTDIKRTVQPSKKKVLTEKNEHDDQHEHRNGSITVVHPLTIIILQCQRLRHIMELHLKASVCDGDVNSKIYLTMNDNKRHGTIGFWGKIMEAAHIRLVAKKENTSPAANKRNNMQDKMSKDFSCKTTLTNCAKDEYEQSHSKTLLYRHHAVVNKVQMDEFETKLLNGYNAIAERDTSVLFLGNTSLKGLCLKQMFFENLVVDFQKKVLCTERLLEAYQGDKSFTKQFRASLEDETSYWLTQNLCYPSFSSYAHDESISFISTFCILAKIFEDTSNRYERQVENKRQRKQGSLDTREDLLRRYRYLLFDQKVPDFIQYFPGGHLYTFPGEAIHTFVCQSKEGYVICERITPEKCRKLLEILEIFDFSGTKSRAVLKGITPTSVLQRTTKVFLSVIDRYCRDNVLVDAVTLYIATTSDIEHHTRYPVIYPHGLSVHQYKAFFGKICQIGNHCNDMHLHFDDAKRNLLALLCRCAPTGMEACTVALLVSVCIPQMSSQKITLAARQNVFLSTSILMDYMDPENVTMPEIEMDPLSCNFFFEFTHDNIFLYSRNLRGKIQGVRMNNLILSIIYLNKNILEQVVFIFLQMQHVSRKLSYSSCMGTQITLCSMKTDGTESVYKRLPNTRHIYILPNHNAFTFCDCFFWLNLVLQTCSINAAKLDKGVLSIPDVRQQPSPSANRETQGRVEGDVFKLSSSKHKEKAKMNETKTKNRSFKAIEIDSIMFNKDLVVETGVTLDKKEHEKHDVLVYLDDRKLQLQNKSGNFNEGSRKEMDLQGRKKRNLRQMIWLHLEELPQPHVHRDVFVGFFSGEYSKSPGGAKTSSTEHEELGEILKRLASDDIPAAQITMKFEMLRLCTFKNYPRENKPFAVRLVAAGFYYAGYRDQLICYCCAIRKDNWVGGDIPISIHQEMSPSCSFLTKNASVNIPMKRQTSAESPSVRLLAIQRSDGSNQSDLAQSESSLLLPSCEQKRFNISSMPHQMLVTNKASSLTHLNASGGQNVVDNLQNVTVHLDSIQEPPPKYPQYAVRNARIRSFQGWSEEIRQRPEEMSECGFYYAGFSDCVRCFYCGVGLRHWMSEDDPWIEHARWSTSCVYVLKMKGEEFISLVQMAVETAKREAARNNSGENQANPNDHREATAIVKHEVDTTGSTTTVGGVGEATVSTPSSGNTDIQKYLLTDAAQSVLDMGYQPKMVLRGIERVLMKKGSEELIAQIIMEAVLEIEEEGTKNQHPPLTPNTSRNHEDTSKDGHETEGGATGSEHSVNQEIDPEMIMREHRELRDASLCKICLDNKISVVFLPCGHLVTCVECAPAMRKCPICRTLIKGTVKAFFG